MEVKKVLFAECDLILIKKRILKFLILKNSLNSIKS